MLSYRHSYHAGNHADVLKHTVLVELLRYLCEKDKRLWYIDTHAGSGMYRLDVNGSVRNGEFHDGIGRLWNAANLPDALQRYLDLVRCCNPDGELTRYPGSPWLADKMLRRGDRLWLSELHPADHETLRAMFQDAKYARVQQTDGFASLRSLLPPEPRRGLIVVDPSYEVKSDYTRLIECLADARRRFPTGVYAIWYPLLRTREAVGFSKNLSAVAGPRSLNVQMTVRDGRGERPGLYGSGMYVVNPPHTLAAALEELMPAMVRLLAQDSAAAFRLEFALP